MPKNLSFAIAAVNALGTMLSLVACVSTPRLALSNAAVNINQPVASPNEASSGVETQGNPAHPFAQHGVAYVAGTLQPHPGSGERLDRATRTFYDAWKARYVVTGCSPDRAYVFVNADGPATGGGRAPDSISISEGHGYGMLIMALMAGYDQQAKTLFDRLFRFYRDHHSPNAQDLMAWNQVQGCKNATPNETGSATDGDLDIAYALLLADRQWGSLGTIHYRQEATRLMAAIVGHEVSSAGTLLLGDFVNRDPGSYEDGTRPSDFMPGHFKAFATASGDATWNTVTDACYRIVASVQAKYSPVTGLLPDFVVEASASPRPARANYLEASTDGQYSYNACRVPWRLGTDYLMSGDARAQSAVRSLNAWIRTTTRGIPEQVAEGYSLDGTPVGLGANAAFVGPLGVSAMLDGSHQAWLDALWDWLEIRPMGAEDYYGNTLKLLSMIVMSGNWGAPR